MSVKLMAAIFESETLAPTPRLIMLALADHADDSGRCYPSIGRLRQRTGLSERAVQSNIRALVSAGYIRIIPGGGKSNTNVYFVSANPVADAPRSKCTPAADAPQTPQQMHPNPAADAPEPSGTIIEPSEIPEANASGRDASQTPSADEDFSKQVFDRAIAYLGRHGVKEAQARSFVGKLRKDGSTDAEIFAAFAACSKASAVDPISWIAATLKPKPPPERAINDNVLRLVAEQQEAEERRRASR